MPEHPRTWDPVEVEDWADAALLLHDLLPDVEADHPWTMKDALVYIRAAYGVGYTDAHRYPDAFTPGEAGVLYARLRLALPMPT